MTAEAKRAVDNSIQTETVGAAKLEAKPDTPSGGA
jgi:hypothetical protein